MQLESATQALTDPGAARPSSRPAGARQLAERWAPPAAWAACAIYLSLHALRGWVPWDEGQTAQSAMRVLLGELPHRDYAEVYTGGLAFLHALAFRLLGADLVTPRIVLYLVALCWLPVFSWLAARFTRPLVAAGLTVLALLWSFPNYFASMASWYNLVFATFAAAALLRYADVRRARWLVLAGACAGLSMLVKIPGLYLVAAGLLFLTYLEHAWRPAAAAGSEGAGKLYPLVVSLGLVLFLLALLATLRGRLYPAELLHFFAPAAIMAAYIAWREWALPRAGGAWRRALGLSSLLLPFVAGVALPVLVFLLPYVRANALPALVHGVFVLPFRRTAFAALSPLPVTRSVLYVLPLALLLVLPVARRVPWTVLALVAVALLALAPFQPAVYRWSFQVVRGSVPFLVAGGVGLLLRRRSAGAPPDARQHALVLSLLLLACLTLLQFPLAAPIYFCFVAPLVVLAAAGIFSLQATPPRRLLGVLGVYGAAFAALWLNTGFIYAIGVRYVRSDQTAPLPLERAGLRVPPRDSALYRRVAAEVSAHARGPYIWAGPDAPEVYFLTGRRNPTRDLYEFFERGPGSDDDLLARLQRYHVNTIVVNYDPKYSARPTPELLRRLEALYPRATMIDRFIVAWRE